MHKRYQYLAPAGNDGSDTAGGGAEDRGDDFTPTGDDAAQADGKTLAQAASGEDDEGDADDKKKPDGAAKGDKKAPTKTGAKADATAEADDAEGEGDEEGEGDGGEEKPAKKKPGGIPWSRHKELLKKEREAREAAEKQLQQYQGGDRIAATNEKLTGLEEKITAAEAEYTKLVTDGEAQKAAEKMREIRRLEREHSEMKSDLKVAAAESRAVEKARYDIVVERIEQAYPQLNQDHDDFDEDLAGDVMDLAATYRDRKNMTPAAALQKAVKRLVGDPETAKQKEATEVKPRVDESDVAAAKRDERKKDQVKKNLETQKKQPADTSKVGADSDKAGGGITSKDVMRMKPEEFNKLDEETLSRLRGDVVA